MADKQEVWWLILVGMMLANKTARDEASQKLITEEAPQHLRELVAAAKVNNIDSLNSALSKFEITCVKAGFLRSVVTTIMRHNLEEYVRASIQRAKLAGSLNPETAAKFFEDMSVNIRARQEAVKREEG